MTKAIFSWNTGVFSYSTSERFICRNDELFKLQETLDTVYGSWIVKTGTIQVPPFLPGRAIVLKG